MTTDKARSTGIEWTEHTWNPVLGCSIASAGCTNCYAMLQASKLAAWGSDQYQGLTREVNGKPVWTGIMRQANPAQIVKPRKIKAPSMIFVNSMSDLGHPDALDEWRDAAFDVMREVNRHTYQVLTKRPEVFRRYYDERPHLHGLPNIWIGVSVENARVAGRIDELREIPAAIRFLSVEPLIGSVGPLDLTGIHWVITGGESGPGSRLCLPKWVREVRDQCQEQGVAFFHKQWGTYGSNPLVCEEGLSPARARQLDPDKDAAGVPIGKGGSLLDGRQWREFPAAPGHNGGPPLSDPAPRLL